MCGPDPRKICWPFHYDQQAGKSAFPASVNLLRNGTIRPAPIFDESKPVKEVAGCVLVQITRAAGLGAVAPILDEDQPVKEITLPTVLIEVALAEVWHGDSEVGITRVIHRRVAKRAEADAATTGSW
jgi:hypothetical protein